MSKKVFITGATSGIGRKMAEKCIAKGYTVYATGRNESSLKTLSDLGATVFKADLRSKVDLAYVINQLPVLDVAILNAGLGIFGNFYELAEDDIDNMFETNVRAPIMLARAISQKMMDARKGHLIIVSSQAGKVATKKASIYASSKHALTGFINGARLELADYNIEVTGIYPGPIDTPFLQKADATNAYRLAVKTFLMEPDKVVDATLRTIERPVREVNLPRVMGITSKLYAMAPAIVEFVGKGFFNKK